MNEHFMNKKGILECHIVFCCSYTLCFRNHCKRYLWNGCVGVQPRSKFSYLVLDWTHSRQSTVLAVFQWKILGDFDICGGMCTVCYHQIQTGGPGEEAIRMWLISDQCTMNALKPQNLTWRIHKNDSRFILIYQLGDLWVLVHIRV